MIENMELETTLGFVLSNCGSKAAVIVTHNKNRTETNILVSFLSTSPDFAPVFLFS